MDETNNCTAEWKFYNMQYNAQRWRKNELPLKEEIQTEKYFMGSHRGISMPLTKMLYSLSIEM
jgi:hypothetical protein